MMTMNFSSVYLGFWFGACLCLNPLLAQAQVPVPSKAGVVLVNAVATDGKIAAQYKGEPVISPAGIKKGRATGGLGLPAGTGQLSLVHSVLGATQIPLAVTPGETSVVVAFEGEPMPAGRGEKGKPRLETGILKNVPDPGAYRYQVLWVAGEKAPALPVEINQKKVVLEPWQPVEFRDRSVNLRHGDKEVGNLEGEGKGAWYVLVFGNPDAGYSSVFVPQIIYNWK